MVAMSPSTSRSTVGRFDVWRTCSANALVSMEGIVPGPKSLVTVTRSVTVEGGLPSVVTSLACQLTLDRAVDRMASTSHPDGHTCGSGSGQRSESIKRAVDGA